jgi:membrane-bound lytic murein transglycosylase F
LGLGNLFSKPRNLAVLCLLLGLVLLLVYLPRNAVDFAPRIDPNKKELVFVTHNGPTTYYLGNDNQPAGIEYDLALMFVRDYYPDHEIRFVLANSISEVIPSLLKNKAHIAAANLTVTPLRKHQVQFASPYQETQQQLIFNN